MILGYKEYIILYYLFGIIQVRIMYTHFIRNNYIFAHPYNYYIICSLKWTTPKEFYYYHLVLSIKMTSLEKNLYYMTLL